MRNPMTIDGPQYELGQDVWLLFQGAAIPTSIKVRHFDIDKDAWYYRVAMSGHWHTAEDLGPRPSTDEAGAVS